MKRKPENSEKPCGACGTQASDMLTNDFCTECDRLVLAREVRDLKKRIADLEYLLDFHRDVTCEGHE